MELYLHHYVQRTQVEQEYQQAYIDSLRSIPTILSASFTNLSNIKFLHHYPDFTPHFKEIVGEITSPAKWSYYCNKKVNSDPYIHRCAEKFIKEKQDKIIEFFWNIDLENIFCLTASDITALSFNNTKITNYTKKPKVIKSKLDSQILQLLYSQQISTKKTSRSFTSMAYFLMNRFTQPYYSCKTIENIFSMISRRVKSKFFLTKLSLIGQQYLSTGLFFKDPQFLLIDIRYIIIKKHYINFMPFLQAMSSNRIDIMLFNDFKWFSQIIQTTQTTQTIQTTQTTSIQEKTGELLDPTLARLVEYIKSILFFESKEICFKLCMFWIVLYSHRLLFEKNRENEIRFMCHIFTDNPEIPEMFHYILNGIKLPFLRSLEQTKPEYYHSIKTYAEKFDFIVDRLIVIHDGSLNLQITQLLGEKCDTIPKEASPLQKIVFYILNN